MTAVAFEYAAFENRARLTPSTYWRRRAVVLVVLFGLVLALATMAARLGRDPLIASEPFSSAQLVGQYTHVVQTGDTLWTIARAAQPEGDVRPLVQALAASRRGAPLQVGEKITVPAVALTHEVSGLRER